MRIIVFFDLPQKEKFETKIYRKFIKYLENEGYYRVQFSIFAKLCINSSVVTTLKKNLELNCPINGDIRYIVVSEKQFLDIENINNVYTIQEKAINTKRLLIIGGDNDN